VKSRTLSGGEWSALTEAAFIVGVPASAASLAVSEMMYNPIGSSESTEFIELMNISSTLGIDMTNVHFGGITYNFEAGLVLPPLGRVVVCKDRDAFLAAYPGFSGVLAPGNYTGSLSNGGETITVFSENGSIIRSFNYGTAFPWPDTPDGLGDTLVLVAPQGNPDHNVASNWRASASDLGLPGESDTLAFTGDPSEDLDADGRTRLMEYAVGSSDLQNDAEPVLVSGLLMTDGGDGPEEFLSITYSRELAADDVFYEPQVSSDLLNWSSMEMIRVSEVINNDGTSTVTYRSVFPFTERAAEYMRLKVMLR
jgi:hypothetical protein